jgi:2-amino-4-hydroxy-6-hydroxymethyldihydropteridine diphosphokinase
MLKPKLLRAGMNKVFLGLGSNVGDKLESINNAINYFLWDSRFFEVKVSSVYESKPYGEIEQNNFYNGAICFLTNLDVEQVFKITKELENRIGRIKRQNWGPREIDIDILLFGDKVLNNEKLTIPHEDLLNRDFVIVPLLELDEEIVHPIENKKIKTFLSELEDKYIVDKVNLDLI